MAGKKGKEDIEDDLDLDDLSSLDEDMDFGELEDIDESRNPTKAGIAKDLSKEAASGFLEGLVTKTAKKSLPEEYEYNISEGLEYVDFGKEVIDKNKNRIEKTLFKLGSEVKKILPFQSKLLDNFLEKYAEENTKFQQQSEEAMREAGIQSNIASIFDRQLEVQKALEAKREAKEKVEGKERLVSTKMTLDVLSSIDNNISQQSAFTLQIGKEYYKKSLELQYKSYFIQADMLKTMRDYYKGFSVQFDSIIKNTGLPEYVKLTNMERAGELVRNKIMESTYKKVFSNSRYVESVKKRMDGLVSNKVEDILSGVDSFSDQLEMLNSAADSPSGVARLLAGVFAGMGGGSLGEKVADKISPKIKGKIKDNKTINAGGKYLDMLVNSPTTFFATMREKIDRKREEYQGENTPAEMLGNRVFGGLSELLSATTPESMEYKVKAESALSHKSPAIFDNKFHRSVTEVIPMYLAGILKQNTDLTKMYTEANKKVLGTNFGLSETLHYDYEGRKLVTAGTLKSNVEQKILGNNGAKARSKSLSASLVRQSKNVLSKDKKTNAKELKILNSKESSDLLESYFFKASKIKGIDKNYQTLIADISDPKKQLNPELAKIVGEDSKLKELLTILKKTQGTESTDSIDRSLSDLGTIYPTAALKKLLSDTSKLAGSKILNTITDDNAQKLAAGFFSYIMKSKMDVTPTTVLNGKALREIDEKNFPALKNNLMVFTTEIKKVLMSKDIAAESSLNVLFGMLNKNLREGADRNPEVFQTLYDLNPILQGKGNLTAENLMEGKLGNFREVPKVSLEDIKSVTKTVKLDVNEARSDIFKTFTESDIFKGTLDFKKDLDAAGKDPRKIFSAVTKHAKKLSNSIASKSMEYYDKASEKFGELEKVATKLAADKTDEAAKATLAIMITKVQELEGSIVGLIETERSSLVEKERTLNEMKSKLSETANDSKTERSIEKEIKLTRAYHNDKIKILESIRVTISNQNKRLVDIQSSSEGKSVVDLVKEVRGVLSSNIEKLKDLVKKAKEVEDLANNSDLGN